MRLTRRKLTATHALCRCCPTPLFYVHTVQWEYAYNTWYKRTLAELCECPFVSCVVCILSLHCTHSLSAVCVCTHYVHTPMHTLAERSVCMHALRTHTRLTLPESPRARSMSPSMQDSIAQLGAFVGATTARPPPQPEYMGYDPVFKSHYPKFYGVMGVRPDFVVCRRVLLLSLWRKEVLTCFSRTIFSPCACTVLSWKTTPSIVPILTLFCWLSCGCRV